VTHKCCKGSDDATYDNLKDAEKCEQYQNVDGGISQDGKHIDGGCTNDEDTNEDEPKHETRSDQHGESQRCHYVSYGEKIKMWEAK
jgi:hypothetical protein